MTLLRRNMCIEARAASDATKPVQVVSSTDTPLRRGRYIETLDHAPGAMQDGATSVLRNHNPDVVVGRIESTENDGHQVRDAIGFAPTAPGKEEETLVRGGFVRGISVGYSIEEYEWTERSDDDLVDIRVTKWVRREISTTPIPADLNAGVESRSVGAAAWSEDAPDSFERMLAGARCIRRIPRTATRSTTPAAIAAPQEPTVTTPNAPTPDDAAKRSAELDKRAAELARRELLLDLHRLARSHGVELADADLEKVTERADGVQLILERKSKSEVTPPAGGGPGAPRIEVTRDGAEKIVDEAIDGLFAGRRMTDIARRFAARRNLTALAELPADDLLEGLRAALGKMDTRGLILEDGKFNYRAVLVSSDFGTITQLAAAKAAHDGFMSYAAEYPKWCREYYVPDFNTVTVSGLGLAELAAPANEGDAYGDTSIEVAGGSGANEFLGTNIDVSLKSMYNDRMNIILGSFRDIGRTGHRTLDKISQVALAAADFGSATQALAFSEANLATAYGAHAGVTIKGVAARRLIVPMGLYVAGKNAVTPANGATAGRTLAADDAIGVVKGWFLSDANDWYLAADPADAPVVAILRHPDYQIPRLVSKGETGAPSTGVRVDFPAKAIVLTKATAKPLCAYKCTQS